MPVIDLLRHGETTQPDRLNGRNDPPLSDEGWVQMRRQIANRNWTSIVTSPALRASEPAREIADRTGLRAHSDPRWWEMDFGDWDGQTFEALRTDPASQAGLRRMRAEPHMVTPPNGEPWSAFTDRIRDALMALDDGTLVVCHAGVIRAALHVSCAIPLDTLWTFRIGYAARVKLHYGTDDSGALWGEIVELVQS